MKHFRAFFGRKNLRGITYGELLTYGDARFKVRTQYGRQHAVASWNREAAVLRSVFGVACRQGWLVKNPFNCGDPFVIVSAERRREMLLTMPGREAAKRSFRVTKVMPSYRVLLDGLGGEHTQDEFEPVR